MARGIKVRVEQVEEALRKTKGMISLAAEQLQVERTVIYRAMDKHPYLKELVDSYRDTLVDIAELKLREAILNREPWAVALTLKTLGKRRGYSETSEDGKPNKTVIEIVHTKPDDLTD